MPRRRPEGGEHNLGAFLRERSELVAQLGPLDLDADDAVLALQLAPAVGRHKRATAEAVAIARATRAETAVRRLAASASHEADRVEREVDVLLGDLLAGGQKYIAFELTTVPVILRGVAK